MTDGTLVIDTALDTKGIDAGVDKIKKSLSKAGKAAAAIFSVKTLVNFAKQSIEFASDIAEVDNVVQKAFGGMRGEMDALANESIKTLGMSRLTAYKTGSTFMSMGKSMVASQEAAKNMALELTKLTGNMASFFNVSQDLASIALKSIYTGETETLKQYGVVMTEVNLKQFALSQGIKKSYSAMTQSEKVMLRYKYVMSQLSYIGDDFLDTQDSWANQTRILKEQWKEFMSIIGQGLVNVLTPVIKVLNQIVASLINLGKSISAVLAKLGFQSKTATNTVNNFDDMSDAVNGYGDALANASKKAKKSVREFDELNMVSSPSSSDASGGGDTFTLDDFNTDVAETEHVTNEFLDKLTDRINELKEVFKEGFTSTMSDDFAETTNRISDNISRIKEETKKIFDSPEVQESSKNFVESFTRNLGKLTGSVTKFGLHVADTFTNTVADNLEEDGEDIKQVITEILDNASDLLDNLAEFGDVFLNEILAPIIDALIKVLVPTVGIVLQTIGKILAEILKAISEVVGGITDILKGLIKFLTGVFTLEWKTAWEGLTDIVSGVKRSLKGIVNGIIGIIEALVNAVIKGVNKMIGAINKLSITIPSWVPEVGGERIGFYLDKVQEVKIPRLASGAVIPPNREFMAVLGDQKSGTNIETPLDTMVQAFNMALDARDGDRDRILNEILQAIIRKDMTIKSDDLFKSVRKSAREYTTSTGKLAW
mgnify:CR=1 FL=1